MDSVTMHTVWVRLNAVVFFGLTVLLVLAVLTWLSTLVVGPDAAPVVEFVKLNSLRSLRSHGGVDRALISFDARADLAAAFDWNIKQLFVFVVAEYASKTNPLNQVRRCRGGERARDARVAGWGARTRDAARRDALVTGRHLGLHHRVARGRPP